MVSDTPTAKLPITSFDEKLVRLTELPSLPAVITEVLRQIDSQSSTAAGVVEKIGQDPPLTARILRIANSPFFGLSREIGSLREAVVLLGFNRVRELVISAAFHQVFPASKGAFDPDQFWRHSMATATCARQMAGRLGINQECAFTAGLLHDIGRLVLGNLFPDEFSRVLSERESGGLRLFETERQVLGVDHAEIGGKAASRWNFPPSIKEAIEKHHAVPAADSAKSLATVVYAANALISEAEKSEETEWRWSEETRFVLDLLEVPAAEAETLAKAALEVADSIAAMD